MSDRHLPQHKDPDRVQRPAEEALSAQPEASVPIDTAPNSVALSGSPPANPTVRQLRRSSIQQTQHQLGNRHVARMLAQRDPAAASSSAAGGPSASSSASSPAAPSGLIVDDSVADLQPGQAKKSQFLAQLRAQVDATVQAELGSTPLLAQANQEIETRFAQYNGLSGPALEQTIKRETPGAGAATTAQEYIAPICAQVRSKVAEQRAALPPGAEAAASAVGAVAGAASSVAAGVSSVASSVAGVLFKAREGGAHAPDDPRAVQAQLTAGQPLDGQVRGGLEQAFGANLSDVRVHTGGQAAQLSEQMNARAFTVGRDIGFGAGEYQPGTPVGDALIAHEAAHVLQQGSASTPVVQQKGGDYGALEADADRSAVGAVASMWGGARGALASLWGGTKGNIAQLARTSIPQLTTGLRLQGCGGSTATPAVADLTRVPDGPARNAATQLRASSQEIDRNTAQHLADGSITAYYMDDLRQPPNVDTLVRGWGYDPTVYTAYLEPPGNTEYMLVQRNSSGFRRQGTSKIFGWRRLSVDVWQTLLVHETNHALNPNVTAPVERYKSEFRAYWVAEFRGVADLDDRARQIKAHILRDYPIISVPYNDATHPEVKQQIDAHTRPDGNVTNR